jgi:hypothetical protein
VRHVRMLGLCLVAALALGAYAVSSASALEWGKCENIGSGGNYAGPNCSKSEKATPKGTGEYEWRKATEVAEKRVAEGKTANVPFSGGSVGGGGVLTTGLRSCMSSESEFVYLHVTRQACEEAGGNEEMISTSEPLYVECANETNTGEAEGKNKVANVHVLFTGCAALGVIPCNSESMETGEIATGTLKGKLGWINKAAKEVGVVLEPAQKHGSFAEFECGGGFIGTVVGVGNKKEGSEYVQGEQYPEGCYGAAKTENVPVYEERYNEETEEYEQVEVGRETVRVPGGCPGATPSEEKHGGYDQIISPITPVNTMTSEFEQVFTDEAEFPWRNLPSNLEGKHLSALEDIIINSAGQRSQWSPAGEVVTNVNTPEEAGEIKA